MGFHTVATVEISSPKNKKIRKFKLNLSYSKQIHVCTELTDAVDELEWDDILLQHNTKPVITSTWVAQSTGYTASSFRSKNSFVEDKTGMFKCWNPYSQVIAEFHWSWFHFQVIAHEEDSDVWQYFAIDTCCALHVINKLKNYTLHIKLISLSFWVILSYHITPPFVCVSAYIVWNHLFGSSCQCASYTGWLSFKQPSPKCCHAVSYRTGLGSSRGRLATDNHLIWHSSVCIAPAGTMISHL